jgi:hypothetical protein
MAKKPTTGPGALVVTIAILPSKATTPTNVPRKRGWIVPKVASQEAQWLGARLVLLAPVRSRLASIGVGNTRSSRKRSSGFTQTR